MIAGAFWEGSGLGNQLHRFVMTRVLALDKGLDFGMIYPENFKGSSFLNLDMGVPVKGLLHEFIEEKTTNAEGVDVRGYDPKLTLVEDFTLIDGEFQGENYYKHRLDEIRKWLAPTGNRVTNLDWDKECVIAFRGGEYVGVPQLFLNKDYWLKAVAEIMKIDESINFRVVTDDVETAKRFFPMFPVTHEIGDDWCSIRYAKYLILSNSSFGILPALLNEKVEKVIAPKYWARPYSNYWALEQNQYANWTYI